MRQARFTTLLLLTLLAGCAGAPEVAPTAAPAAALTPAPTAVVVSTPAPTAAPTAMPTSPPTAQPPTPTAAPALPSPVAAPLTDIKPQGMPLPPTPEQALPAALAAFQGDALLMSPSERDRFLRLAAPDGSRFLWLTPDENICGYANSSAVQGGFWSHDGRYIAIVCEDNSNSEVGRLSILDTQTGQHRLVDRRSDMTYVLWSPVASRLLAERWPRREDDTYEFALVDAAKAAVRPLIAFTSAGGWTFDAAWSPDGAQVAVYGREKDQPRQKMYLLDADSGKITRLDLGNAPEFYSFNGQLAWHTDGRALLFNRQFQRGENTYTFQAVRYDLASQKLDVIADDMPDSAQFRSSPDGAWYAVGVPQGDRVALRWTLYRADGALVRDISQDAGRDTVDLAWLPDSSKMVIAGVRSGFGTEVLVADPAAGEQVIASFPGVVAIRNGLRIAPGGDLVAVGITEDRSVIVDLQGRVRAVLQAKVWGWRPVGDKMTR